jgi:hypothetical protein
MIGPFLFQHRGETREEYEMEENTEAPVESGEDTAIETAPIESGEVTEAQPEEKVEAKTFTQEELDAIVEKRLAKERRKQERQQQQPQLRPQEPALSRENFATEEEYIDAVAEVKAHQKLAHSEQQKVWKAFSDKELEAEDKYPDYMDVTRKMALSDFMLSAVIDEPNSTEVLYRLGTNPKEAAKIAALPPRQQIKEIGKLSARLEIKEEKPKASNAPEPIKPIGAKGKATKGVQDMDDNEFAEYRRKIRAQRGR